MFIFNKYLCKITITRHFQQYSLLSYCRLYILFSGSSQIIQHVMQKLECNILVYVYIDIIYARYIYVYYSHGHYENIGGQCGLSDWCLTPLNNYGFKNRSNIHETIHFAGVYRKRCFMEVIVVLEILSSNLT